MDAFDRIMELSREGLYCAQIMVQLALDAEGKENPELIEAVRGLCGGFAWSGGPCGALSGGACLLSLLGRGLDISEREELVAEFHRWFAGRTAQFGGEDCNDITGGDRGNMFSVCPGVIIDSYEKCVELLAERGLA
ncbi:MAG TPA: C_GCAxxG_C_C family protein [Candidatus Scatomorpha stercoravium]|nr:C_GCAxxG_C_C family protein [Candidatus Scatomorpha stercoravium]